MCNLETYEITELFSVQEGFYISFIRIIDDSLFLVKETNGDGADFIEIDLGKCKVMIYGSVPYYYTNFSSCAFYGDLVCFFYERGRTENLMIYNLITQKVVKNEISFEPQYIYMNEASVFSSTKHQTSMYDYSFEE